MRPLVRNQLHFLRHLCTAKKTDILVSLPLGATITITAEFAVPFTETEYRKSNK